MECKKNGLRSTGLRDSFCLSMDIEDIPASPGAPYLPTRGIPGTKREEIHDNAFRTLKVLCFMKAIILGIN